MWTWETRASHCHVHHVCIGHPSPSAFELLDMSCTCDRTGPEDMGR